MIATTIERDPTPLAESFTHDLVADLFLKIRSAILQDPPTAVQHLDEIECLLDLKQHHHEVKEQGVRFGGLASWQIARVKAHVQVNLSTPLFTAELAQLVRLSDNHFARAFKASFRIPPHAYVMHCRIERAKELMLWTDAPLVQIALTCGLADQAHLSRLFRRMVGTSPSIWRRRQRAPGASAYQLTGSAA